MSTDPASLNLSVSFTGLSTAEVGALLTSVPAGARWGGTTSQPPLGGRRYEVTISNLSVKGARDLTAALHTYVESVAAEVAAPVNLGSTRRLSPETWTRLGIGENDR